MMLGDSSQGSADAAALIPQRRPPSPEYVCLSGALRKDWDPGRHIYSIITEKAICTQPSSPGDGSGKLIPQRGNYSSELRDTYTFQLR